MHHRRRRRIKTQNELPCFHTQSAYSFIPLYQLDPPPHSSLHCRPFAFSIDNPNTLLESNMPKDCWSVLLCLASFSIELECTPCRGSNKFEILLFMIIELVNLVEEVSTARIMRMCHRNVHCMSKFLFSFIFTT